MTFILKGRDETEPTQTLKPDPHVETADLQMKYLVATFCLFTFLETGFPVWIHEMKPKDKLVRENAAERLS